MPSPTPRTRTNDPAGLRRRVLDATQRSFQAVGYGGTSMHDIVREAAVTGGACTTTSPLRRTSPSR